MSCYNVQLSEDRKMFIMIMGAIGVIALIAFGSSALINDYLDSIGEKIDRLDCGGLKEYILDTDNPRRQYAEFRYLWMCEK